MQMLHTKLSSDLPGISWEEDVTCNARRTTDDDGCQSIAIGHLSVNAFQQTVKVGQMSFM